MNKDRILPPLPKLRRRPGMVRDNNSDIIPPPKKRKISPDNQPTEVTDEDQTSRLLTKSECGRGGKKNSGSLIHSIPKFTEVVPKGNQEIKLLLQKKVLLSKPQLGRDHREASTSAAVTTHSINSSPGITPLRHSSLGYSNEGKQVRQFTYQTE